MYDLDDVLEECEWNLEEIGIKYGEVLDIHTNSRATKRWGLTTRTKNGYYIIEISKTLADERNPRESLKKVVMHELLHTCPDTNGHDKKWKEYAKRVNRAYGYNITTTDNSKSLGIVINCVPKKIRYRFQCQNCGAIVEKQRASKFTKNPELYQCSRCGGEFKEIKN